MLNQLEKLKEKIENKIEEREFDFTIESLNTFLD